MISALPIIHALACLVILLEALFKANLANPCKTGLCPHTRALEALKGAAWGLLAFGAGAAVMLPLLANAQAAPHGVLYSALYAPPTLQGTAIVLGFAVLIIRTRIKEG